MLGKDPGETDGYLRFFYRGWRPTLFGRIYTRIFAWAVGRGYGSHLLISLRTTDHTTGRTHSHVLAPVNYAGERYLVSMLGDRSNWVQDIKAHPLAVLNTPRGATPVRLIDVPVPDRPAVIKAWCQVATSGRRHLPVQPDAPEQAFQAIAADYPVFRVDPEP